jgi:hypothetical protein
MTLDKSLSKVDQFYNQIKNEALKLEINEQLEDVWILLGYQHPKQFQNIFDAVASGWKPITTDFADVFAAKNQIYAVMKAVAGLRLDLLERRARGEGEQVDRLKHSGEISSILFQLLTDKYVGKWCKESQILKGWVSLKKHSLIFCRKSKRLLFKSEEVFSVPGPIGTLVDSVLSS